MTANHSSTDFFESLPKMELSLLILPYSTMAETQAISKMGNKR